MPISDRLDAALRDLKLDGVPFDDFVDSTRSPDGARMWFPGEFGTAIASRTLTPQAWTTKVQAGPGEARTLWGRISTAPFPAGEVNSPNGMHWTNNPV